jgi:PAS domain S-box-containing protein
MARTILIADDSAYWTDTLADALRKKGFAVSAVSDGLEALERIRAQLPDILITDYFLPKLDGGKLCQLAKKLAADLRITTVILTGGADRNLSRAPSRNADAVIAKNAVDVVLFDLLRTLEELDGSARRGQPNSDVIGHERLPPRALSTKIRGLKDHLDALHEGIGDAVIAVDGDRRITFLNSMAIELLGVPEEVAVARKVELVLGVDATHPISKRLEAALEKEQSSLAPITVALGASTLRVTVARLNNSQREDSALIIARDISDLVAAEAERASLNAQLHAADKMRSLGQMTAGLSHEINNPLAALLPGLEILRARFEVLSAAATAAAVNEPPSDALIKALDDIPDLLSETLAAGRQIKSVVGEMRFFAHPGSSKGERAQLDHLLNDALSLVSREVRYKARLDREFDYTPELVVDRAVLSQAVLNILINASQAIEGGTPEDSWIRIKTYRREGGVAVEISNSGPAVPDEAIGKVFDPFFTTKDPGAGVGLGLSIAYETVARHGGYIELVKGMPTTFRIWLPLDTGKVLDSLPVGSLPVEGSSHPIETTPARVLIVDDERLVRNGFRRVLAQHYEVSLASGGTHALGMIRDNEYDVILCDLLMPEVTGMDLYQRVMRSNPEAAVRFVFLTGGTACAEARDFLQSVKNVRAFKPLDNSELIRLVENAARSARARHQGVSAASTSMTDKGGVAPVVQLPLTTEGRVPLRTRTSGD